MPLLENEALQNLPPSLLLPLLGLLGSLEVVLQLALQLPRLGLGSLWMLHLMKSFSLLQEVVCDSTTITISNLNKLNTIHQQGDKSSHLFGSLPSTMFRRSGAELGTGTRLCSTIVR